METFKTHRTFGKVRVISEDNQFITIELVDGSSKKLIKKYVTFDEVIESLDVQKSKWLKENMYEIMGEIEKQADSPFSISKNIKHIKDAFLKALEIKFDGTNGFEILTNSNLKDTSFSDIEDFNNEQIENQKKHL